AFRSHCRPSRKGHRFFNLTKRHPAARMASNSHRKETKATGIVSDYPLIFDNRQGSIGEG
ncbi:MAG: hypothetical protein ACM3KE_01695, partial [Hyphomicrobiales bacterium]